MTDSDKGKFELGKGYYVKYSGTNMSYKEWYEKSEAMTASRMDGCWEAVETDCKEAIAKEKAGGTLTDEDKKLLKKNKKAIEYLTLALEGGAYRAIRKGRGNAYQVNQYLKNRFYKQTMDEMVTIEDKMSDLKMGEKDDPSDIAEKLERFNDHLADIDPNIEKSDQQMISIFLNKLPKEKYHTFVEGIRTKEMSSLTIDAVVEKATDYYDRNIKSEKEENKSVFNTHTSGGGDGGRKPKFEGRCRIPWCRKMGHKAFDCFLNPKSKNCKPELMEKARREYYKKKDSQGKPDNSEVTCFKCGQKGHKSYECPQSQSNQVNSLFAGATVIETEEEINNTFGKDAWDDSDVVGDDFFDTFGVGIDNEEKADESLEDLRAEPVQANGIDFGEIQGQAEMFAADSGASDHFVFSDTHMYDASKPVRASAVTTDGKKTDIVKAGNIDLMSDEGVVLTLNGSNCVPTFKKNLISIGRCINDGWKVSFEGKDLMIMVKGGSVLKFKKGVDNIYYLAAKRMPPGQVQVLETTRRVKMDINEAHDKFDHPCEDLLRQTAKEFGIELTGKLESCEGCARSKAKQKRVSHTTEAKETFVGERFYLDQSGPFDKSWNGKQYLECALDGYSGASFVNFGAAKDEIVPWFTSIVEYMESVGKPIKCVRADNAGENVKALTELCNKKGIKLELTPPGTPQMNGKVERRQTVLIHKALASMHAANLKESTRQKLWNEAVNHANDTVAITYSRTTGSYPYKKFNQKESRLAKHLQPFGRIGEVAKKEKIHGKWTEKSTQMIVVGYAKNTTPDTYRMYNPNTKKVCETRDITWMDWKRQDPQRNGSIFNQVPELVKEKPGIDEVEIVRMNEPHEIPDEADGESVPEAGRKGDSASDPDAPDPCNETTEQLQQPTRAEQRRDKRLKSALRQLETSLDISPREMARMGRGKRGEVRFEDETQEIQGEQQGEHFEGNSTTGGETTATAVEPDNTVHTVHFVFNTAVSSDSGEPKSAKEAFQHPDPVERERWRKSGITEFNNFLERNSWSKYPRNKVAEQGRKIIGTKLVFKKKSEAAGSTAKDTYGTVRYKTRGVTLGYQQIPGIDYTESHSPVATDVSIRMAIAMTLYHDHWDMHVIDIEAAFLEGKLKNPMYIEWLPGMVELGKISKEDADKYVCLLTGGMYGNVEAALAFFREYREHLIKKMKMKQSLTDPCVFYLRDDQGKLVLIALLHVDDTLMAGEAKWIKWYKAMVGERFKYRDEGKLKKHLGVRYEWKTDPETNERYIEATMPKLVDEIIEAYGEYKGSEPKEFETPGYPSQILKKYEGEAVDPTNYRSIVGKAIYLVTKILPEGSNAARDLAKHFSNPGPDHWKSVGRMVGHLKKHKDELRLTFRKPKELRASNSSDSDYALAEDRRSVSGNVGTLGGCITDWQSSTQQTVSLSSAEAEYYSAAKGVQGLLFKINLLTELTGKAVTPAMLIEDNEGCIFMIKNQATSARTKHIDIRAHFIREHYLKSQFDVLKAESSEQDADPLTKNLCEKDHRRHSENYRNGTPFVYQHWEDFVQQISNGG